MIKNLPSLGALRKMTIAAGLLLTTSVAQAQFTNGNVVVLQVGDGAAALTSAGTAVFLKEFTPSGTAATSITIPATGLHRLVMSGTATSEGLMTLSADSTKLVIGGYDTTVGTVSVATTATAFTARVVDTVSILGIPGRADSTRSAFNGGNIRSVTRGASENYWAVGSNTGTYYMGNLAAPALIQTSSTSIRAVLTANGNLYYSVNSTAAGPIIYKISGQPVIATTPVALISTTISGSPYGFAVNAAENIFYIADDRSIANGGGIQKWTATGGVWSLAYTLAPPAGARSVIADWSGASPVLYAITTDNKLVKATDAGAASTFTVLSTAATNTAYRSVSFAPKAPPACTNPVLALTPTARKCTSGGAVSLSVTSGSTPTSYSWTGPGGFTATTQNISGLTAAGTYVVNVMTAGGCTANASANVLDSASITATLTAGGATTVCQGDSVLLSANTGTGYTYQFNNPGGAITGATGATYRAGATGAYTVTVTSGTCTATSSPAVNVTVNPRPIASFTASADTGCKAPGTPILLTAPIGTGYTYQWGYGDTVITVPMNVFYISAFGGAGEYASDSTRLILTNADGCTDTSAWRVFTFYGPDPVILYSNGTLSTSKPYTAYQWLRNGTLIPNATSATYTPTRDGQYNVRVTGGPGCSDTATIDYEIGGLGIHNAASANVVKVYPNPAANVFSIEAPSLVNIRLRDMQGRVIAERKHAKQMDISSLADGVYLLSATDDSGALIQTLRVVKQR